MEYRIFPSIGIARIGDSTEFFVGPEVVGSSGRELDGSEVAHFKDSTFRVRKQAARFHVFQRPDANSPWTPLPAGTVTWSVGLGNKKDAIKRPNGPPDPLQASPLQQIRPELDPARADRFIQAAGSIDSTAAAGTATVLIGKHVGVDVKLGELRLDDSGRLLVLGGDMVSASNPSSPIGGSFYNNKNWHDDVSDGPVSAKIALPGGGTADAVGAWVVVGPPDFARGADPICTLFDLMLEVAIKQNLGGPWVAAVPAVPSFTADIQPILRRARSLGWVHMDASGTAPNPEPNWGAISQDYPALNSKSSMQAAVDLRRTTRDLIMNVETARLLDRFRVPGRLKTFLQKWVDGNFHDDWTGPQPVAATPTAESLTRAALEGAVGQGFFPGIEAGRITADPSIYLKPFDFRIDPGVLSVGDLTALMAQPWQADFLKCAINWWPSQRPDIAKQSNGTFAFWHRPLDPDNNSGEHARLVKFAPKFGVVTVKYDTHGVQVSSSEEGRDPGLPTV